MEKKRHYCVVCYRKRNADLFYQIRNRFNGNRFWVCSSCINEDGLKLTIITRPADVGRLPWETKDDH